MILFSWLFVAQLELIDNNLNGANIRSLVTSSSFECQTECIDDPQCVAVQTALTNDNRINCVLKSSSSASGPKQPSTENFRLCM